MSAEIDSLQHPSLAKLPNTVLALIADHLTALNSGSCKDVVKLAATSKQMWTCMDDSVALSHFWREQCTRLGWILGSLDFETRSLHYPHAWSYFCGRMKLRWLLRCRLKVFKRFLNLASFMSCRPPATVETLQQAETSLGCRLPFDLFELYRMHDGQDDSFVHHISFFKGARLLRLEEVVQETFQRYEAVAIKQAYQELVSMETTTNANIQGDNQSQALGRLPGGGRTTIGGGGGYEGLRASSLLPATPTVLIPFTTEMRGRKQYCIDLQGRVWLTSGFNNLHVSDSLSELFHRTLI